jgi:hypothetical protein
MPRPRVLIASVTAASPVILTAHLKTVLAAASNSDADCDFLYLVDPTASEATGWALSDAGIPWQHASPKAPDAGYEVREDSHQWTLGAFYWLGAQKESLLAHARAGKYDAIWLLDSDLLVAPDTLASLLACRKPVISSVFWTRWQPSQPALPNVWRTHPYGFDGMGEDGASFLRRLENRELVRVRGLGACTLIRDDALAKVTFKPVPNLPSDGMWQGEDRSFCLNAEAAHVELWADAWPDIFHAYRPSDEKSVIDVQCWFDMQGICMPTHSPRIGDLISLTIEPLEEPALAQTVIHVRGRLGALRLLPALEATVLSMTVGSERFLPLTFPASYPLAEYRGLTRLVRVRLLGAKPFRPADALSDHMVQASA